MLEALASYREVRQALKEQKNNRGYFPGKGLGNGNAKGKGKTRVHKEQLKLRTRCWRRGQVGHISAECNSKLSVKESSKVPASPPPGIPPTSQASSSQCPTARALALSSLPDKASRIFGCANLQSAGQRIRGSIQECPGSCG